MLLSLPSAYLAISATPTSLNAQLAKQMRLAETRALLAQLAPNTIGCRRLCKGWSSVSPTLGLAGEEILFSCGARWSARWGRVCRSAPAAQWEHPLYRRNLRVLDLSSTSLFRDAGCRSPFDSNGERSTSKFTLKVLVKRLTRRVKQPICM